MRRNFVGDFLPKLLAALGMYGGIADDGKFSHARGDKYQDAIFLLGFVHAQMHERFLRGGHGVFRFLAADEDTDFTAGFFLSLADGRHDRVMLKLG